MVVQILLAIFAYLCIGTFSFNFWKVFDPECDGNWRGCVYLILGPISFLFIILRIFAELGEKAGKYIRDFNS